MGTVASKTTYLLKLQNRYEVAERTMAFEFEKPEGFVFKAGQAIDMTVVNPPETDAEANTRAFSIATAARSATASTRLTSSSSQFLVGLFDST